MPVSTNHERYHHHARPATTRKFWISFLLSPLQTGYYKAAKALINLVMLPITPFIGATYPELTRAVGGESLGDASAACCGA